MVVVVSSCLYLFCISAKLVTILKALSVERV